MKIDKDYGFRSAFYFVPGWVRRTAALIPELKKNGFEIGVHVTTFSMTKNSLGLELYSRREQYSLIGFCQNETRLKLAKFTYPFVKVSSNSRDLLNSDDVQAVARDSFINVKYGCATREISHPAANILLY
jgi:peptidoglycan/xylan/chitin deacetylase (PgdA/CDA1 family)